MAAAGKPPKEKDPVNIVHQNAIHCETIRKEQRTQVLYTDYSVNPYKKRKWPPIRCQTDCQESDYDWHICTGPVYLYMAFG